MKKIISTVIKPLIHSVYSLVQFTYGFLNRFLSSFINLPPMVLRIRITNECDLSCNYCYLKGYLNQTESNHLSLEEWKKIIDQLPRWTIIDITGAEPFKAKNFGAILNLLLEKGFKISLITNGQTIDEELIDLMVRKKLFYLMVSLDGFEKTHNQVRQNEEAFSKVKEFCLKLNETKSKYNSSSPALCIKTSLLENNQDEMSELQDFVFQELKADHHTLNLLFQNKARGGGAIANEWNFPSLHEGNTQAYDTKTQEKIKSTLYSLAQKAKLKKRNLQVKPPMMASDWVHYISSPSDFGVKNCSRPFSIATMYYDGTLTPCDLAVKTANIRDLNFNMSLLWNSSGFRRFYKKFQSSGEFKKACEGCNLTQQCRK